MNEIKPKPIFIKTFFENKIKVEPLNQYTLPLRNGNGRKNIYLTCIKKRRQKYNFQTTTGELWFPHPHFIHTDIQHFQYNNSMRSSPYKWFDVPKSTISLWSGTDQSLDLITRLSLNINNQLYNVCTLTSFSRIFCYDLT